MINVSTIESDCFYTLTPSAQALYMHLMMNADDDGIVDMWKSLLRCLSVRAIHLDSLIEKGYVIKLDENLLLISDWLLHNKIRLDKYNEGRYKDKLSTVVIQPNGRYIKASEDFFAPQHN